MLKSTKEKMCIAYTESLYLNASLKFKSTSLPETYGEILPISLSSLLKHLVITEKDIFVDFGSGNGKTLIQVFLESPVKEAWGIELLEDLHLSAQTYVDKLRSDLPLFFNGRALKLYNQDFLSFPLETASIAFINSACFGQDILKTLSQRINKIQSFHTVISTRPLPLLNRLNFKKTIRVECSWDSALCYLYTK